MVEKESYLLELSRYVVLNPVRAGMVKDAADWPWSSHRAMLGLAVRPKWLQTEWLLGQFGSRRKRAIERYEGFVRAGVGQGIWVELKNQIYLGDEQFVERLQRTIPNADNLREIPKVQRRVKGKPLDYYARKGREGMALAYLAGDYTMQQIADHFGVHYSTVSRAVKEYEEQ